MNQILSINNTQGKKTKIKQNKPIEINSILKFFAVVLLIFGIFMVGSGSYSMYKNMQNDGTNLKPTINVEQISETEIKLKVSHTKGISSVKYHWNDEEEIEIQTNGKNNIEQTIEMPTGSNMLYIYAKDVNSQEINYQRTYTRESEIDVNIEKDGNNITITAEGKNELKFMTYRWDEEEETTIEINSNQTEQSIETPKGEHTLTVVVVDINNNTETKEQDIKGVTKPTVEVTTDGTNFIIKASDEEGLKKVQFIINNDENQKFMIDLEKDLPLEERKQFEYAYPLNDGENKLEIRVFNVNDAVQINKVMFVKQ